jgi:thymidylate synthase (FAD)
MGHLIVPEAEALLDKEIRVLDKGFIRLVDYLGGDARIVQTARVSYGAGTRTAREDAALIDYLLRNGHTSPFEHVILEVHCKLPIFVARQWIRHRTARLNELSGRYSVLTEEFYVPPADQVRRQATDNKQGRSPEEVPPELRAQVLDLLRRDQAAAYASYQSLLKDDLARELARINLPVSLYTQWYWQIDLHNLFHLLALRLDPHAQWEIRQYAEVLWTLARAVAPLAAASFERHQLKGCRLSADEVDAVRRIVRGQTNPLTGRPLAEFNRKLFPEGEPGTDSRRPVPAAHAMTREQINALPLKRYEGPVHLVRDDKALEAAVQALRKETVLGFDTETQPSFQKGESHPVALIQLAGARGAYIFQLRALRDPAPLLDLLANPGIRKAGVATGRDVQDLRKLHSFEPAGFVDLADLAKKAGIGHGGLRGLAAAVLGFRFSKGAQRSNWGREALSDEQIHYAAMDAWVGRELYLALSRKA